MFMYVQFIYYLSLQLILGWLLGWAAAAATADIVYNNYEKHAVNDSGVLWVCNVA